MHREALDSPSRVRRFIAEARALGRLRHPKIVGRARQRPDGWTAATSSSWTCVKGVRRSRALIKAGRCPSTAPRHWSRRRRGHRAAHARGVVHRDLKPANVLLDHEGDPKITDFGLAKVLDRTMPSSRTSAGGSSAPPVTWPRTGRAASRRGRPAADIYGLGGILFALLTGKPPIQGDSLTQVLAQIVSLDPVRSPA